MVIDGVTESPGVVKLLRFCSEVFTNVFIFMSSDVFALYYKGDTLLANYREIRFEPLTREQQYELINNAAVALALQDPLTDDYVDEIEDRVDSVIFSNKIVPRYPFFVLSVVQTFDACMPSNFAITSYGHCYSAFIMASLSRAGIADDSALTAALNFAEQLALAIFHKEDTEQLEVFDFATFKEQYDSQYFIEPYIINRLTNDVFGIITEKGAFQSAYMYYFFLGKVLATDSLLAQRHLLRMCEYSEVDGNYFTLLFAIHHARDGDIVDGLVRMLQGELKEVPAATLNSEETRRFASLIEALPQSIEPTRPVPEERARQRRIQDRIEEEFADQEEDLHLKGARDYTNVLRVLKTNRILGQVLRTQHGRLRREQIEDIVESITDSSFRLVNLVLKDEREIERFAKRVKAQRPGANIEDIRHIVQTLSFMWTIANLEQAVFAVNVPNIKGAVEAVVDRHRSPAYEIFGYFYLLDSGGGLNSEVRDQLADLFRRHRDLFVRRLLSIRTQVYVHTHRAKMPMIQSVFAVLDVDYTAHYRAKGIQIR